MSAYVVPVEVVSVVVVIVVSVVAVASEIMAVVVVARGTHNGVSGCRAGGGRLSGGCPAGVVSEGVDTVVL